MMQFIKQYSTTAVVIGTIVLAVVGLGTFIQVGNQNLRDDLHKVDERLSDDLDKVDDRLSGEINYARQDIEQDIRGIEEEMRRNQEQLRILLGEHRHDDDGRAFFYGPRETDFCLRADENRSNTRNVISISSMEGVDNVRCGYSR
ncbi:MAG: hypothetical protein F4X64_05765 [Chloroflexi bacterium]|nr:hypothetical protein [Chloroflexota bacterium]